MFLIGDNSSIAFVCTEMEGLTHAHNGRMGGKVNGIGRNGEIDCFG